MNEPPKQIFIHSHDLDHVRYPAHCPFDTSRAGRVRWNLEAMSLLSGVHRRVVPPPPADRKLLERFHTAAYLDALELAGRRELDSRGLSMGLGSDDCPVFDGVFDYAARGCGGTILGARMILAGEAAVAFNPAGGFHHAHASRASGFCYLNDIVLACIALIDAGKRVAVVDIDVHHGDGVQDAFYDRPEVFTISLHESGRTLFPGTGFPADMGEGDGLGFSVNIPLPAGTYDQVYVRTFEELVLPLLQAYDPDVVVMEIGADALAGDPLAHLALSNNAYARVISLIRDLDRPILATGGGGYSL